MKKALLGSVLAISLVLPVPGMAGAPQVSKGGNTAIVMLVIGLAAVLLGSQMGGTTVSTKNAGSDTEARKGPPLMKF